MAESKFNGVVILDAIPDGELNTARYLKDDLDDISFYCAENLQVRYFRIVQKRDLEAAMANVMNEIRNINLKPWIHLEGHGLSDETGFIFANGTRCKWDELNALITPLNVALGLNLMLILATCYGGSFARSIRTTDRAPVLGLIGPRKEVSIGVVKDSFSAFYKTFFETLSYSEAIKSLNAKVPEGSYYRTTAERFFYDVWTSYKKIQCSKEEIEKRARRMYREAKSSQLPHVPSVGQLKRIIKNSESEIFSKHRDCYFMRDIYAENEERFPVSYKEAERRARR